MDLSISLGLGEFIEQMRFLIWAGVSMCLGVIVFVVLFVLFVGFVNYLDVFLKWWESR